MGSRQAKYNDIAPQPRHPLFSTSAKKFPRSGSRPRAYGPLGHDPDLGNFLASDEKKVPRLRGYIVVYSPPRPHIYITNIPLVCPVYFCYFWSKSHQYRGQKNKIFGREGYIVVYMNRGWALFIYMPCAQGMYI